MPGCLYTDLYDTHNIESAFCYSWFQKASMKIEPETKVCTRWKCPHQGEEQPLHNFPLNKLSPDGRHAWCRDCISLYNRTRYQLQAQGLKPRTCAQCHYIYPDTIFDPPWSKICPSCTESNQEQPEPEWIKMGQEMAREILEHLE